MNYRVSSVLRKEARVSGLVRAMRRLGLAKMPKGGLGFGNLRVNNPRVADNLISMRKSIAEELDNLTAAERRVRIVHNSPSIYDELDNASKQIQLEFLAPGSTKYWNDLLGDISRKSGITTMDGLQWLHKALKNNLSEMSRESLTPLLRSALKSKDTIWLTGRSALSRNSELLHGIVPNLKFIYGSGPAKSGFIKSVSDFLTSSQALALKRKGLADYIKSLRS